MIDILKKVYEVLFYKPNKFIKKKKNIVNGEGNIYFRTCKFRISPTNSVKIGNNCMLGCEFIFESDKGNISIGDNTFIHSGTKLLSRSSVVIGNDVMISWGCTIYDHNSHSLHWEERVKDLNDTRVDYNNKRDLINSKNWDTVKASPIIIKDKVWIGFDSTILCGVTIGEGAIVGAKSVVRKDVEPWTVVIGNPARVVKKLKNE